jgi:hypothetical protein
MARNNASKAVAGNEVMVALNYPQGIKFALPGGRKVVINGNAAHLRNREKGILPVGAFGLTNVPADDWEYIKKFYGGMEIFKSGLIFAQTSAAKAKDEAAEKESLRHGREPVDPERTNTEPVQSSDLAGIA